MQNIKTALSIASLSLLQSACGGSSDDNSNNSGLAENTLAPELIATWVTDCNGQSSSTSTTTTNSSGGGTSSVRGDYTITSYTFNQDGSGSASKDEFSESNCNSSFRVTSSNIDIDYTIGDTTLDNNGMNATEININYNDNISYTLFRITNNDLFIADAENSNTGNDGTTVNTRFDGFGSDAYNQQ